MRIQIQNKYEFAKDVLTWVAPSVGIPSLRYFQDSKEQRRELFIRDAATYSLGAVTFLTLFFGGKKAIGHFFPTMRKEVKEFIAFVPALTANILYSGIGAVRLSKYFSQKQQENQSPPRPTVPIVSPPPLPVSRNTAINSRSNRIYLNA